MNVLVVDDNPRNIQIVGNILKAQSYHIAYAMDGAKALELAAQHAFDLVLLDVMMPGMDGFEVCRKMRETEEMREVPIIFLTAKTDTASIVKGFELGANDYVNKPFNSLELIARVKTQLEISSKRQQLDQLNKNLEQKVAERTLELEHANKSLKRLEKSKSDFLAVIGHELRTPLNALLGLTTLLQSTTLSLEQQEFLFSMKQASGRLARFSELALLITTLQTRHELPDMFQLRVNVLFEMAVHELQFLAAERSVLVETNALPDEMMVLGDAELIRKCLVILLENAIHQLDPGGCVTLGAVLENQHQICLQVSDNGPGFSQDILDLFKENNEQPFRPSRMLGGLSLTAVKLIMDAHGGSMALSNQPDGGARVCLKFNLFDN